MRAAILIGAFAASVASGACGTNETPQPAPIAALPDCTPNNDGMITADELPIAIGATLDYYQSPPGATRTVDLVGSNGRWDMSVQAADDVVVGLGPIALHDQWYAASFPGSQFVVPASSGSNALDGIYHQDDQALWLDGTATHDEAPPAGKTLVVYATPVAVLRFPITDGDAFTTVAPIGSAGPAEIDGLPFIGSDTYDIDVTGSGRLDVPFVDFEPVLRVRTHLTRAPTSGTPVVGTRTTAFLFECFGEIAHAESRVNEPDADFTTAALLRRFALGETP